MIDYQKPQGERYFVASRSRLRCDDLAMIAQACDGRVIGSDENLAPSKISQWPVADILLVELFSDPEEAEPILSDLALYLVNHRSHLLLWTNLDLLELAYGILPADRSHFMVDARDVEAMPVLTAISRQMNMDQFHDRTRDGEYQSLHKISDELADFARTLARIAEQETSDSQLLRDKPVSFRPAPPDAFRPMVDDSKPVKSDEAAQVRNLIKLRRLRDRHFDASLFADPAWDILLDLYAAKLEGRQVSVSSLCIAAAVPPTTALRWITSMTEHGALVREQDPNDARRVFIALSEDSEEKLRAYFADIAARAGLPI